MYPGPPTLPCVHHPAPPRVHHVFLHVAAVHGAGHAEEAQPALTRAVTEVTVSGTSVTAPSPVSLLVTTLGSGSQEAGRKTRKDTSGRKRAVSAIPELNAESGVSGLLVDSGQSGFQGRLSSGVFSEVT